LQLQKVQLSNLVSGDTEHQEESAMADASPRTDISTDVDTDDKNPRVKLHFTFHGIFFFLDFEPV